MTLANNKETDLKEKQSMFCRYHFPDWINESPIGGSWSNTDAEQCLKDWIEATAKILEFSFYAKVDIIGKIIDTKFLPEVTLNTKPEATVQVYLYGNMLEDTVNEHIDFVKTQCFTGGHHELDIHNIAIRNKNLEVAREVFSKLYPDVKLPYKLETILKYKYNNNLVAC